jgi:hypothetical protein
MYDVRRDAAQMNARMHETAAFGATLLGEHFLITDTEVG